MSIGKGNGIDIPVSGLSSGRFQYVQPGVVSAGVRSPKKSDDLPPVETVPVITPPPIPIPPSAEAPKPDSHFNPPSFNPAKHQRRLSLLERILFGVAGAGIIAAGISMIDLNPTRGENGIRLKAWHVANNVFGGIAMPLAIDTFGGICLYSAIFNKNIYQ